MAQIYLNYGDNLQEMTYTLMEAADIAARLNTSMKVCIKPNLVVSRPAGDGATTHPEIVEGIIRYLQDHGVDNICIAEGSWVGGSTKRAFENCGYTAISKQCGVPLVDTKKDKVLKRKYEGLDLGICETIAAADYLINVPVLKGHCQTDMTCCLKNMKGWIPDGEKRRYHTMGLHKPIAALNTILKPQLHIIDNICGDLTFEEGGNPVETGRVLLGFDPVLLDSYCAGLMGYHPDEIGYLQYARQYGVGGYFDNTTEIMELNAENRPVATQSRSSIAKRLADHIDEDSACSACYAALIFALHKTPSRPAGDRIKIGQGFKGKRCTGIGVGNCTAGCREFVGGCPPRALDIVEFLERR